MPNIIIIKIIRYKIVVYFANVDRYKKQFGSNFFIWFYKSNLTILLVQENTKQEKKREKDRKKERNSSNRRVRIAKDSHRPSSIQIWSSWRSCSWLWSNPGSLGTRLCSRSNHRIYVAWSVKGSTAAWGAYLTAPTHLCPTKYRVSLLLFAPRSDAPLISKVKHAVGSAAR